VPGQDYDQAGACLCGSALLQKAGERAGCAFMDACHAAVSWRMELGYTCMCRLGWQAGVALIRRYCLATPLGWEVKCFHLKVLLLPEVAPSLSEITAPTWRYRSAQTYTRRLG